MIKNSLKNFAKNLVLLFIPMGIFYMFIIFAIFGLFSATVESLQRMITELAELIHLSSETSSASVNQFLAYSLEQLNWNGSLLDVARQILSTGWLQTTVKGFFETLSASTEGFEEQVLAVVTEFKDSVGAIIAVAVTVLGLGIVCANYATRFAVRKNIVKGGIKKFIIAHTVVPLVQSVFLTVAFGLLAVTKLYGLLLIFVVLLILSGASLINAWIIHRDDKLTYQEVVTSKNVLGHLASSLILLLIDGVAVALLFLLSPILAILMMVPLLIYTLNIADANADSFICALVEKKKLPTA